ncbi:MAG: ribosomal protein [Pseudomonadota bacterium]|jgi:large subunit ribosomal protein L9
MEIILLEKIANLGGLGDKVSVKPGYGRNYLIPKGKAVVATAAKVAEFEQRRAELEAKAHAELAKAEARAASFADVVVTIQQKAGDEGRLYGSVSGRDIAEAATAQGVAIEKHEVRLPHGSLRHLGEFSVTIHLHTDVNAELAVHILPE